MATKQVDVRFTFKYLDRRRKYTCRDFGLKSIPYGEGDDTEADGLPAYQEELSHVKDVLCQAIGKFNSSNDGVHITAPTLSDEWISLYNRDEKRNKLDVEIEVAVKTTMDCQFNNLPDDKWKESDVICDKVKDALKELASLSNGCAFPDSCSYD